MIEIEAKMRLHDPALIEGRLRAVGAVLDQSILETNTFFDTGKGLLKSSDQGLRIRVEDNEADGRRRAVLTHKGPRAHGQLKSRSETEVEVADAHAAGTLLAALGYHPVMSFEKRRRRWLLDDCRVELDTLPHLGDFIEIEGDSDGEVLAVREKLGLADTPLIKASYIAMLQTHLRDQGRDGGVVRLPKVAKGDAA